jgi:hypothetical protein
MARIDEAIGPRFPAGDDSRSVLACPVRIRQDRGGIRTGRVSAGHPARKEPHLFGPAPQPDLFGAAATPPAYRPDPDNVRTRLQKILGEARSADTIPWSRGRTSLYRTVDPQLTLLLPDEEAAQWRLEFETEMTRLGVASIG